jgi:hypothetical protein
MSPSPNPTPRPGSTEARVTLAVTEYLGVDPGPLALALVPDEDHPARPFAVRVLTLHEDPVDLLVHEPYTADTVEEVTFTAWPPRPARRA